LPRGRLVTFSEVVHDAILEQLVQGPLAIEAAAAMAGVPRGELYSWIKVGKLGTEPYATFVRDILITQGVREASLTKSIADSDDWKAKEKLLRILFPDRFGDQPVLSLEHAMFNFDSFTPEELETFRMLVEKAAGQPVLLGLEPKALPARKRDK
jgi:hypothetical protein